MGVPEWYSLICVGGRKFDDENGPLLPWNLTVTLYWHPVLHEA